jgi:hypothetical protein
MLTIVEVIPYSSFKQRLQLMKKYIGKAYIEICEGYLYIERVEDEV